MLFYVTFQTVKYVIEPDKFSDKEQGAGKVVTKMILVVLLIAMVPQIFSLAYTLQNSILKNQIFSKIILGKQDTDVTTYGRSFSETRKVFFSSTFFKLLQNILYKIYS